MKILSVECSATPCSVAITENGNVIAQDFINVGLTHSQVLMPMVDKVLKSAALKLSDIEGYAVSTGPGSFTGIRIGISAVKGMAAKNKTPCAPISTLYSMAYNYLDTDCIICAVMDARCNQVYNAIFDITDGKIRRITDDSALMCDELAKKLKKVSQNYEKCVIIVGDGTEVFFPYSKDIERIEKSTPERRYQNAVSVGMAADDCFKNNNTVLPHDLLPYYLRLPQAERELKLKKEAKQ